MNKDIYKIIYKKILKTKNKFIIIDGITCSGKTSFAKSIKKYLDNKKIRSKIISKDIFLKSREHRIKLIKNKSKKFIDQNDNHYDINKFRKLLNLIINSKNLKKKLYFKNLYSRKSGLNNGELKLNLNSNHFYIIEGLYILKDLENEHKPLIKILLIEDLYYSLSKKLQRIRDNKITLEDVIYEYKNIHLNSFLNYLRKYKKFDLMLNITKNFNGKRVNKNEQIKQIKNFLKKH